MKIRTSQKHTQFEPKYFSDNTGVFTRASDEEENSGNENSKLTMEANCSKQRNFIDSITLNNTTLNHDFLELIHWWMENMTDLLSACNTSKDHEKSMENCLCFCMRKVYRNTWTVKNAGMALFDFIHLEFRVWKVQYFPPKIPILKKTEFFFL